MTFNDLSNARTGKEPPRSPRSLQRLGPSRQANKGISIPQLLGYLGVNLGFKSFILPLTTLDQYLLAPREE
jgi:hypothetical protein